LRNALVWLDNWESNVTKNLISEDKFLTKNTAEGLIVTIPSTIDIINYLHGCGFDYVLTSKINQDCVEVSILHSNYLFEINKNYIINYFCYNIESFVVLKYLHNYTYAFNIVMTIIVLIVL